MGNTCTAYDSSEVNQLIRQCRPNDFTEFINIMEMMPPTPPEEFSAWRLAFLYKSLTLVDCQHDIGFHSAKIVCDFHELVSMSRLATTKQSYTNLYFIYLATGNREYTAHIPSDILFDIVNNH